MLSLHEPHFTVDDENTLLECIRSSWVSTTGKYIDEFERKIADFTGAKYAASTANGTLGIQLALHCLALKKAIQKPFEVIVPTLTFIATANAIIHAGGIPVFVDTKSGSLNGSLESIQALIKNRYTYSKSEKCWLSSEGRPLLCILPAHIMGWGGEITEVAAFAEEHGIPVIEDAAEALGSRMSDGKHLGTYGLAGVLSFNGNKILTTGGGGLVLTNDESFFNMLKHMSTTAKSDGLRFEHDQIGFNYRLTNLLAALGVSQFNRFEATLVRKKEIFSIYKEAFSKVSTVSVYEEANQQPNFWLVNAIFESYERREKALKALLDRGVQARPIWQLVHKQKPYEKFVDASQHFPYAEEMWERALSLPSSPSLKQEELDLVVGGVLEGVS